jgi:MFS family permease
VFGSAAIVTTVMHPICGRLADRFGARRVTGFGFLLAAAMMPATSRVWNFQSAACLFMLQAGSATLVITPSLAYMAEATTAAGVRSFGVSYGLYNLAWGAGLLGGPALGGFLFDRLGFGWLLLAWAPPLAAMSGLFLTAKPAAFALTSSRSGSTARR